MSDQAEWTAANQLMWDERVGIHVGSSFYDLPGFIAGRESLQPFEGDEVGPVVRKCLVHLQCHFGMDTLSWARRGAKVSGLDFSGPAVEQARALALRLGIEADFVQSDVYDAVAALGGRRFDIVYTGIGALTWLPDIPRWARVVAELIEPGGFLYLLELHPTADVYADTELVAEYDYFHEQPKAWDEPGTYADGGAATVHNKSFDWTHGLGKVVTALIDAGLQLEFLHEFEYTVYPRWPFLEKHGTDEYRLPAGMPRIPLMYSLRARKVASASPGRE